MLRLLFPISIALILISCRSIQVEAPDIIANTVDSIPEQPISYIKVPIKVDLTPYFNETNDAVPTSFSGEEKTCEGVSFSYKFLRAPIQFDGKGKELHFDVDGKYALQLSYCPQCTELFSSEGNCVTPRLHASCGIGESMRKMHVGYSTEIGVDKNYQLTSKTTLRTVKALTPCKITVFNYDATKTLEEEVTGALKDVEKDIDNEISSISLKEDMQETWDALREPVDLEGYGYFVMNPEAISMSKISYEGKYAVFDALIQARPSVELTKPDLNGAKIPALCNHLNKNGFEIVMDINATYDSLSYMLTKSIKGTKVDVKKKEVIFQDISVYGAADKKLSIEVQFEGSKKGTIYLQGTPVFDSVSQHISFPDLTFDVKTKSVLLKSAKWLFDKKITETIRDAASMDLKPYLDTLKQELNETINMEIDKGIYMSGEVNSATISIILPMADKLFVRAKGTGKLRIDM